LSSGCCRNFREQPTCRRTQRRIYLPNITPQAPEALGPFSPWKGELLASCSPGVPPLGSSAGKARPGTKLLFLLASRGQAAKAMARFVSGAAGGWWAPGSTRQTQTGGGGHPVPGHRIPEWSGLEGTSVGHPAQPPWVRTRRGTSAL